MADVQCCFPVKNRDRLTSMADGIQKNSHRILVVDDDKDIVQTIKGNLELDGYEVLTAFNGIMRREFNFPIIMLTARDGVADKVLGLESGADDYMVKPFNFLELSARIKSIFKRVERSLAKNLYEYNDLSINFKSRSVSIYGKNVKLTKTEYELLELFVSYPNEVLSREFIQQQIWRDSQLYQTSRAVDVHVQRLRKKIESEVETPKYIVTVAGVGYKFQTS